MSAENSEVLPAGSVAVALMNWPAGVTTGAVNVKLARPALSVCARTEPRKVRPWPKPEGSGVGFEKSWMVNVVLGVLSSVPSTVVLVETFDVAEVSTGKFCRLLGP